MSKYMVSSSLAKLLCHAAPGTTSMASQSGAGELNWEKGRKDEVQGLGIRDPIFHRTFSNWLGAIKF